MPPSNRPRNPVRFARKHWAAVLAPPYLLSLVVLRDRFPEGIAFPAAALPGFLLFLSVLGWNFLKCRTGGRIPDHETILVWGGVAAMEIHAVIPFVARSRTVPAVLFFLLSFLLPAYIAVPAAVACALWFPAIVAGNLPFSSEAWSTVALGAVAVTAGALVRRRTGSPMQGKETVRDAIAHGRSIVQTRAETPPGIPTREWRSAEESTLLRRETELRDAIRRSLETVLPLTGASHAAYLAPSNSPGRTDHEGILVTLGGEAPREFSVPDTYVPLREATFFRRPFLEDGESADRYSPRGPGLAIRPTGVAAVPILREGKPEGALLVFREERGPWAGPVVPLLDLVAFFIGGEIERARAQHRVDRRFLREGWYHQMVRKMAQISPPREGNGEEDLRTRRERVYAEAAAQARLQSGAGRVLLVASADGGRNGRLVREDTASGGRTEENPVPLADTYVGWVIRKGSQRLFSEPQGPPRSQDVMPEPWRVPGERSFIVLPAEAPGGFRGAVVCTHTEERRFHRGDADHVRDIVEVMQLGLSHVEHLETLTRNATTDGLTGLSNRKAFLAHLQGELSRLDGRHPCAIVLLDIDHFKRVNDTYGHPFGDEVLRRVAGILAKAVRKGDAAGRYGGEEFALYLHMTPPEQAREVAERFRRMIRQARYLHDGRQVTVTASLGVACSPVHGREAGELLKRADEALYISKNRGRDRVTLYPG